jgi:peptidoglycan/LPS O-acetylase OafA/YrhL
MPERSIVPYFLLMPLYLAVAYVVVQRNCFYQRITSPDAQSRYESLDGLRGFRAMGVFFHHAIVTHALYLTGEWLPSKGMYWLLGPGSVAFFFVITGFLFWSKAIHNGARVGAIKLWKNRLLRIGPMCLFSVFIMVLLAAVQSHFQWKEPAGKLMPDVLGCLSMGIVSPTFNGVNLGNFNAHVFWTLRYEWCFYIALPLLAWFATPRRLPWLCIMAIPLGVAVVPYWSASSSQKYLIFLRSSTEFVGEVWLGKLAKCVI